MARIHSMTGFARVSATVGGGITLVLEGRSVNARGLDIKVRMPAGLEAHNTLVREAASGHVTRGNITLGLSIETAAPQHTIAINDDLAIVLAAKGWELAEKAKVDPPTADGVLAMRGVVEIVEKDQSESEEAIVAALPALAADFFAALAQMRAAEGAKLHEVLSKQLADIATMAAEARADSAAVPAEIKSRMMKQLDELLADRSGMDETRLEQEVALLVVKADIREELDRLDAHISEFAGLVDKGGVAGRRLDFLTQELNREANTLCSKAPTMELKRIGLDLKTVIDQMREQVQNVE